jgi:hypothetical protein
MHNLLRNLDHRLTPIFIAHEETTCLTSDSLGNAPNKFLTGSIVAVVSDGKSIPDTSIQW